MVARGLEDKGFRCPVPSRFMGLSAEKLTALLAAEGVTAPDGSPIQGVFTHPSGFTGAVKGEGPEAAIAVARHIIACACFERGEFLLPQS